MLDNSVEVVARATKDARHQPAPRARLAACGQPEVVLDLAVLMSLPGVSQRRDAPVLKHLLGISSARWFRSVGFLQAALDHGDREQVGRLTHRITKSSALAGALHLGPAPARWQIEAGAPLDPADRGHNRGGLGNVRQPCSTKGLLGADEPAASKLGLDHDRNPQDTCPDRR